MKLKLGQKLMVGFLPVILVVALLGGITYRELTHLHEITGRQEMLVDKYADVLALSLAIKDLQGLPIHYLEMNDSRYQTRFTEIQTIVMANWNRLARETMTTAERDEWAVARRNLDNLVEAATVTFAGGTLELHGSAHSPMDTLDSAAATLEADMERLRGIADAEMVAAQEQLEALQIRIKYALSAAILAVAVLGVGAAYFSARRISGPLRMFEQSARRVAGGDLSVPELPVTSGDELGDMARAYNQMVRDLRLLVGSVASSATTVTHAAEHLRITVQLVSETAENVNLEMDRVSAGATQQHVSIREAGQVVKQVQTTIAQIASGAEEQATSALQLAGIVSDMAVAVANVAERSSLVAVSAVETKAAAAHGAKVVKETVQHMEQVQQAVLSAEDQMKTLSRQSDQIGAITQGIREIAEQTNLLALNAAIEAARAGVHGQGFAVVASEVRRLAERAAHSAADIVALVQTIQTETLRVTEALNTGSETVVTGVSLAHGAWEALNTIQSMVQQTTEQIEAISETGQRLAASSSTVARSVEGAASSAEQNSAAAEEMAAGAEQVASAMREVASISQANKDAGAAVSASVVNMNRSTKEIQASAGALNETAQELLAQIGRFSLSETVPR